MSEWIYLRILSVYFIFLKEYIYETRERAALDVHAAKTNIMARIPSPVGTLQKPRKKH